MKKRLLGGFLVAAILATAGIVAAQVSTTEASAKSHTAQSIPLVGAGISAQQSEADGKPFIGIAIRSILEDSNTSGALIVRVIEGSAADGNLQVNDTITAMDGESIDRPSDVVRIVREHSPGDVIVFGIVRDDTSMDISVTAGERPEADYEGKGGEWRGNHKFNLFGKVAENFVLSDTRYMTDDGVKTVRTAVGTAQDIDAGAGTFALLLRDGSETLSFTIDDNTKIVADAVEGAAGISDLSADITTMVIEVTQPDGTRQVQLVAQGEFRGTIHRLTERNGSDMMPRLERHNSDSGFSPRRFFNRFRDSDGDDAQP